MCDSSTSAVRDAVATTSACNQANPVCGTNSKYKPTRRRAHMHTDTQQLHTAVYAYTWDDECANRHMQVCMYINI